MGKEIPDVCGASSPKRKMQALKTGKSCHKGKLVLFWCAVIFLIPCVLFFVFLTLYALLRSSDPVGQLSECKVELQNQTSQMRASIASLGKRVEETGSDLEKARAERERLRAQLAVTNQSLVKTSQDWGSCQEQLKSLGQNVTSQVREAVQREVEKYKIAEEEIKQLKQQLSSLMDTQQKREQQQKVCQATIQRLEKQLTNQAFDGSYGGLLLGPSTVLLPLTFAVLLL
ncbi:uncharacterized protein LOC134488338 isoform X2 [Candoia aspera]|uniref:uncharacterized protein LOC134488338 isoform X2 n=1 Tax=Candoia aspera TaxID=51853 RepID=UPI002FD807B8